MGTLFPCLQIGPKEKLYPSHLLGPFLKGAFVSSQGGVMCASLTLSCWGDKHTDPYSGSRSPGALAWGRTGCLRGLMISAGSLD